MFQVTSVLLIATVTWTAAAQSGGCPMSCHCDTNRNDVQCDGNSQVLATIIKDLPYETQSLTISGASTSIITKLDFQDMPARQLLELSITHGQLKEVREQAFTELHSLRILKLNNNQLYSISGTAFNGLGDLQTLDLSENRLQQLSDTAIFRPITSLRQLNVSNNFISDIANNLFSFQRSLQTLLLERNKLGNIRGASFQGLQNIRTLNMGHCNIRAIDNEFFEVLINVDTLDLSYNDLHTLPSGTNLRHMRSMRNLDLKGNKLSIITNGQFQGLNLNVLDLSRNTISQLSENTFYGMTSVHDLDLSHNNLNDLPQYVFQPIALQLYKLKLNENNGLRMLPPNIFSDMNTMQELNLSSCSLQEFDEQHFTSMYNLKQIDISHNLVKYLPQSLVDRLNFIQHVKLEYNPWHCDCRVEPLRSWLQSQVSASVIYCSDETRTRFNQQCPSLTCASPGRLHAQQISSVQENQLEQCLNGGGGSAVPLDVIIGIVVGLIVFALIVILLVFFFYRRHKRGEPLLCSGDDNSDRSKERKGERKGDFFKEKKQRRHVDKDVGSSNESDKSFVVRNYFSSMHPGDPEGMSMSRGTPSMTRKDSYDSESAITGRDSKQSSQYSLNAGYSKESAV